MDGRYTWWLLVNYALGHMRTMLEVLGIISQQLFNISSGSLGKQVEKFEDFTSKLNFIGVNDKF